MDKDIDKKQDGRLKPDDLLKVKGGIADLRKAPREKTVDISDDTKSKI